MRDNISVLTLTEPPRRLRPPRPRAVQRNGDVVTYRAHVRAFPYAVIIAGGDRSRLVFLPDGSILISNHPRPTTRGSQR